MALFRVGCVPYVNARPLVAAFDHPNEFVEVLYDVPSRLPAMLDSGQVDAILVSSIELLRRDDLLPVAEVGIMSYGPVMSVRLLSKVPLAQIKTLALDESSMTSNILAQVILAEQGVFPTVETLPPDATDMLANHDACVIIGDKGFEADGTGLIDVDLGQAWTDMTGLPFVWALWLGKRERKLQCDLLRQVLRMAYIASGFDSLHQELSWQEIKGMPEERMNRLIEASFFDSPRRDYVIQSTAERCGWSEDQIRKYLSLGVCFDHGGANNALEKFAELINKHGLSTVELPLELRWFDLRDRVAALVPGKNPGAGRAKRSAEKSLNPFPNIDWLPFRSLAGMVRLVLAVEWDPIGVFGYASTLDEYDSYVVDVVDLLESGVADQEVANHLTNIQTTKMGSRPKREVLAHNVYVARKLIVARRNFKG